MGRRLLNLIVACLFALSFAAQAKADISVDAGNLSRPSSQKTPSLAPGAGAPTLVETPVNTQELTPSDRQSEAPAAPAAIPGQSAIEPPEDPCLPALYKDWQEMSQNSDEKTSRTEYASCRIVIDRANFQLTVFGVRKDGSADEIYSTHVGLGDLSSPTPEGDFVINHVYCYPDVLYFDASGEKVPGLYNGFFAPLLSCDEQGRCKRFRELGIHGFHGASARAHNVRVSSTSTYGAISSGCVRVPDPCRLKSELIRLSGLGPIKRNDRGAYHWLARPIDVIITGNYPGTEEPTTLVSIVQQGVEQVHDGLKNFLGIFGR